MATLDSTYLQQQNSVDKSNFVVNVKPSDSPLFSMIGSSKATARIKENVQDEYADADENNAIPEGGTFQDDDITSRTVETNWMQIFSRVLNITGTQEEVGKYGGITSEISYQLKKKYTELANDVEKAIIQGSSATGSTTVARKLSGLIEKITTNTATADVTNATWTGTSNANLVAYEKLFNDSFEQMWGTGQSADTVLVGGKQKRRISDLSDKVQKNIDAQERTQIKVIELYQSDFGTVNIILDRYVPDDTILFLALDMIDISYLRPFQHKKLAKTTDSTRIAIIGELTLDMKTEKAGGMLQAVTP